MQLSNKWFALSALLLVGCAGVDKVGPEVPLPEVAQKSVAQSVASQMKDPNSVEFQNWHAFENQNGLVVCGEINAKNSFGGYVGFVHFVAHASRDGHLLTPSAVASAPNGDPDAVIDAIWKQYYPGC
ncbi:MAG: hypothetical protein WDM89_08515 [Rhizomicrobium sp.]